MKILSSAAIRNIDAQTNQYDNITSDEWTNITIKTGSPGNLEGHTAVIIDNGMYIIGGHRSGSTLPNIHCYICE